MIPQALIESALQLTGKTMEEMNMYYDIPNDLCYTFSIEKFWWYLLSHEFIEKYNKNRFKGYQPYIINYEYQNESLKKSIWVCISDYQSWNETHLIELLSKICPTDQTM